MGPIPIAIDSVTQGASDEWPKLNGFHWRYFTPISGDISPYLYLVFVPHATWTSNAFLFFLPITSWWLNQPMPVKLDQISPGIGGKNTKKLVNHLA